MVERDPQPSPHQAIADDLQRKIRTGELAAHDQLPNAAELATRQSCTTDAAQHALITLRNAGLIYFTRDKGAFVAENPPLVRVMWERFRRIQGRPTYRQESERSGLDLQVDYETELTEAPAEVGERLGIEEGAPVSETSYRISMGGQPVSMSVCWEPLAITGGTEIERPHEGPHAGKGIVPRFDAIGYHVDAEDENLQIRMPLRHEALQLELPSDVPVAQIWQTFWAGDRAVEVAKIIFRADRYEFYYRTKID